MGQYHTLFAAGGAGTFETLDPWSFGCGVKLLEQAWVDSPYVAAVGLLCGENGPWYCRRLVVVGDYSEPSDLVNGESVDHLYWVAHEKRWPTSDADLEQWRASGNPNDVARAELTERCRPLVPLLADRSDLATGVVSEATGWSFGSPKGSGHFHVCTKPADFSERSAMWRSMPGDDVLFATERGEYLEPAAFASPTNATVMPLCGGVWAAAYTMLAVSDGRGGGDAHLSPPGRWAGSPVAAVPRAVVGQEGAVDVTPWLLACTQEFSP